MKNHVSAPASSKPRPFLGILAAGIAAYLTALCVLPTAGLLSTLPTAALFSLAASYFCRETWEIPTLMGVMPAVLTCLLGFSPKRAVWVGLACVLQSVLILLAKRAFRTVRKGSADVRTKSLAVGMAAAVLCLCAYLAAFGNPISALLSQNRARALVKERYDGIVSTKATYYEMLSHAYLTEITFEAGAFDTRYYLNAEARDDYDAFCREKLYDAAKDYFESQTTLERESTYVYLEKDERILSPETPFDAVRENMEYLLPLSGNILDKSDFESAVEQTKRFFALSDSFRYKSVTLYAGAENGEHYACVLTDGTWSEIQTVEGEKEKHLRQRFGEIQER